MSNIIWFVAKIKILELSNKYRDGSTITQSQDQVKKAIYSILSRDDIISFDKMGNVPLLWGKFGDGMKEQFQDLGDGMKKQFQKCHLEY